MRPTLRRSCAACAKSKHSCDLRTPQCTRCARRKMKCVYANEPLTSSLSGDTAAAEVLAPGRSGDGLGVNGNPLAIARSGSACFTDDSSLSIGSRIGSDSLDPFDSYPRTRLPRELVQRLIHHFLYKIAFQYYPLDLQTESNPFLISWWPLALADPALFHVSLQTASLDVELLAQNGFPNSELLMADSVSLVRRRVVDPLLAAQDETMNSVVTLAAIEFGKGNFAISEMHIEGVKRMVRIRGGIGEVKRTSPLTARMVSWVSLIVMGKPRFQTQDDSRAGDGIPPIPEWHMDPHDPNTELPNLPHNELDHSVRNVLMRLRKIFNEARQIPIPSDRLHDLTCFVMHRLLSPATEEASRQASPISECVRYAILLYMLIIHGPAYYSHAVLLDKIHRQFQRCLESIVPLLDTYDTLVVWLISIGVVSSAGTEHCQWFTQKAGAMAGNLKLHAWDDVKARIKTVLWLQTQHGEQVFQQPWERVLVDDP